MLRNIQCAIILRWGIKVYKGRERVNKRLVLVIFTNMTKNVQNTLYYANNALKMMCLNLNKQIYTIGNTVLNFGNITIFLMFKHAVDIHYLLSRIINIMIHNLQKQTGNDSQKNLVLSQEHANALVFTSLHLKHFLIICKPSCRTFKLTNSASARYSDRSTN